MAGLAPTQPPGPWLEALWGAPGGDLWAVGDDSAILRLPGGGP